MINQFMFGIFGAVVGIFSFDMVRLVGSIVAKREAMGSGDPLLGAMIGAWIGWKSILLTGFLASAFGSFIGGGLLLLGIMKRQSPMPFGPFIALGGFISLLGADRIIKTYMDWFFPTF
jgi:leader peptidase (prepilin peptidase)/N-methyltransferase